MSRIAKAASRTPHAFSGKESPFPSSLTLRIAVSPDALFDMREYAKFRETQGHNRYLDFLKKTSPDEPLAKGAAFPFISKLMKLNRPDQPVLFLTVLPDPLVPNPEKIYFSSLAHGLTPKNTASISAHGPNMSARSFLYKNRKSFDLVLSTRTAETQSALDRGIPAGCVNPAHIPTEYEDEKLHFAFDFDRCIAVCLPRHGEENCTLDMEDFTRQVLRFPGDDKNHQKVWKREERLAKVPGQPGPLISLFRKVSALREALNVDSLRSGVSTSVITARTNGSLVRAENTLMEWKTFPDYFQSTGWASKGEVLNNLHADAFFDDGRHHIEDALEKSPGTLAVHVPWTRKHIERIVNGRNNPPSYSL